MAESPKSTSENLVTAAWDQILEGSCSTCNTAAGTPWASGWVIRPQKPLKFTTLTVRIGDLGLNLKPILGCLGPRKGLSRIAL